VPGICLYFQLHQPLRLRRYSIFDSGSEYFDESRNREVVRKVAESSYLPTNRAILELIRRHDGQFRVAYAISGVALEQCEQHAPEVIESFQQLSKTGCVEFLAETYCHSLSFLYSRDEFAEQVRLHGEKIWKLFRQRPTIFCNTELIYNNDVAQVVDTMGYRAIVADGSRHALGHRSPNFVYSPPGSPSLALLLRNQPLSDDVSLRFGYRGWSEWPLTANKFADWLVGGNGNGHVINLFMDYETFGSRQQTETGIFEFLNELPKELLKRPDTSFLLPSEAIEKYPVSGEYDVPHMSSWANGEPHLSAWLGNAMQSSALHELYRLEREVKSTADSQLLRDWRRLQPSDHFSYMCTMASAENNVRRQLNPYDSPYDSYINYMNVLDNLRSRVGIQLRGRPQKMRS